MSRMILRTISRAALSTAVLAAPAAWADTPQSLSMKIDGKAWESDDDGIAYLQPTKTGLNLIAASKGASAYPPPKTLTDRLAILCKNFENKPRTYAAKDFGPHGCEVTFTKGESRKPMGDPEAKYELAPGGANLLEIASVNGKVIAGKFAFELVDAKTKAKLKITDGTFKAEDRQK